MDYKSLYGKYHLCPKRCKCTINFVFELTYVVLSRFPVFLLHFRPRSPIVGSINRLSARVIFPPREAKREREASTPLVKVWTLVKASNSELGLPVMFDPRTFEVWQLVTQIFATDPEMILELNSVHSYV